MMGFGGNFGLGSVSRNAAPRASIPSFFLTREPVKLGFLPCVCVFGEISQIPSFSKICSKKILFHNLLAVYHFSKIRALQT